MKGDRCYVACIAFYNTSIITCHFAPWRWCIFLGGAWFIPPSPAFIIVSGRLEWSRLMSLCRQATRATACLIRTLFFSYHSQIISRATTATCNHRGLCQDASSPPPSSLTPVSQALFFSSCSFSSSYQQHKDGSERKKMAASHRRAKQLPALLEFLLNFLSMTTPGWQPTHPQTFFQFSPFLAVWRSYVQCCYHHILHIHFTTDMQAFQPQDVFFLNCIYLLYLYTNVILSMTHITKIGSRFDHDAFDMFNQSDHLHTAKLFHKTIWSVQLKMHILAAANWHHQSFGATGCRGHNRHIHTCPHVHAHSCNKAGKDTVSLELSSVNHLLVCMDSCSVNWSAPCMDMFKRGCHDIDVSYEANGGKKWFLSFSNG